MIRTKHLFVAFLGTFIVGVSFMFFPDSSIDPVGAVGTALFGTPRDSYEVLQYAPENRNDVRTRFIERVKSSLREKPIVQKEEEKVAPVVPTITEIPPSLPVQGTVIYQDAILSVVSNSTTSMLESIPQLQETPSTTPGDTLLNF